MIPKHAYGLIESLPTFSSAVARLQKAIEDRVGGVDGVEEAIRQDPALTANLLKLANSAWVGARREIVDIRQAISLVGLVRVRDLAIAARFSGALPKVLMGYGMSVEGLWRHSVAVATLSEKIGMSLRVGEGQPLFVAGLLHDVGKLVAGTMLASHEASLVVSLDEKKLTFIEAEQVQLGTDHGELAEILGQRWKLPQGVVAVGRFHHQPSHEQAAPFQAIVDIVHVADVMAHMLGMGADLGGLARSMNAESAARLGIRRRDLELLASTHVESVRSSLATMRLGAT